MSPSLPTAYTTLPFRHIRVSHVPASSPVPTPIILITLYRPEKHNAFTDIMTEDLVTAFDLLSLDPRVKCIVITGHGKMFCAGADLDTGLNYKEDTALTHRDGGGRVALAIHRCNKPTISAINGPAVGVGITLTLPTSIRLVSSTAKIGFVFSRRGIIMEACSSYFLPRLIGLSRAIHLTTTGSVYPSTSPLLSNLFSEILPADQVLPRALEIAADIAQNTSLVSTKVMRDLMWRGPATAEETHLLDSRVLLELFGGEDKREGVASFLEKRNPEFKANMLENAPSAWPWWKQVDTKPPMTVEEAVKRVEDRAKAKL
ncbi:enoyl- hydratase isomerase protein [Rutstroemia sp. NJR-2017a WRK4]|nr:enoyl- hydratase isomerase protein [Rutstroemia sp. NJR-2017a WRK4]